jgi:hypothetical protein
MLHLAQVHKTGFSSQAGLRLLAVQTSETVWSMIAEADHIVTSGINDYREDSLVLVELSSTNQVLSIRDAKDWLLELVQKFLVTGITPEFLQQETVRAEQWRQSLTLQSQELDRRTLELEARREQIQALEEELKQKKQQLDQMAQALDRRDLDLKHRAEALHQEASELDERRRQA